MTPQSTTARVRGRSMEPLLHEGDLLELAAPVQDPQPGKVYGFSLTGPELVVHRYIGERRFRGDRQSQTESPREDSLFLEVPRLLERRREPETWSIVLGISALGCRNHPVLAPRNSTFRWNWDAILDFARKHRLLSPFAFGLKRCELWQECPEPMRGFLERALREDLLRAEKIEFTIATLASLLPQAHFLKGAQLRKLYPEPCLRAMQDIDLLVPESDFLKACELLATNGFEWSASSREIATYYHQCSLRHTATGITVEVHRSLFQDHRYNFQDELFLNSPLSPEAHILYLCAHAITHWGRHGLALLDIFLYLENHSFDPKRLRELATKYECRNAAAFVLAGIDSWWNRTFSEGLTQAAPLGARARLALAKEFFLFRFDLELYSFPKRLLQFLLTDNPLRFARLYFDKGRRRLASE